MSEFNIEKQNNYRSVRGLRLKFQSAKNVPKTGFYYMESIRPEQTEIPASLHTAVRLGLMPVYARDYC
jgi:hypothetical protein